MISFRHFPALQGGGRYLFPHVAVLFLLLLGFVPANLLRAQDSGEPSSCSPIVEVKIMHSPCGENKGMIGFSFADDPAQTHVEFSLDSGRTYPLNVMDNVGFASFDNLGAGDYYLWARWGNDKCPVELGLFTLDDSACSGSIGDYVWEDTNANGLQDDDEEGVAGVKVELQNPAGELIAETETDLNGLYAFTRLDSGEYKLTFHLPEGFRFTANDIISDTLDSDVWPGTGMTDLILVIPGVFDNTIDAGIIIDCQVPIGKIAGNEENCGAYDPAYIDGNVLLNNGSAVVQYQWQQLVMGSSTWEDIEGAVSPDFDPAMISVTTEYRRLARIGDHCPFVPSNVVSKMVQPGVAVVVEKQDASCGLNNGAAEVVVNGGSPPYVYEWNTGATTPAISDLSAGTYFVMVWNSEGCSAMSRVEIGESEQPNLLLSGINATCGEENGEVTASVSGGVEPYSYFWSTGDTTAVLDSLTSGEYAVTITDALGCVAEGVVGIDASGMPAVSVAGESTTCGSENGIVTATGEGGVTPYSFLWNTGATTQTIGNLAAGQYEVTLTDALGCEATASFEVQALDAPEVATGSTNTSCGEDNGTAVAVATGGTGGYTYLWSTGATSDSIGGLSAGTYGITVTDLLGCTAETTVEIAASVALALTFDVENVACDGEGGRAAATTQGGMLPYVYQWSTGQDSSVIENLEAGAYSVTVQDASGCIAVDTVVLEKEELEVDIEVLFPSCNGGGGVLSVALNGGTGPYEFVWSTGDINPLIDELLPGTYGVTVTDSKGCEATDTETLEELDPLVIEIQQTDATCGDSNGDLEAMVSGGTAPYTYQWSTGGSTSSIGELPAGDYWVFVQDSLGCFGFELAVISESNSPDLEVIKQDVTCGGENGSATALATGMGQFFTYAWSTGDSTAVVDSLQAGIYIVTVSDESKCRQLELFTIEDNSLRVSIAKLEAATCNEANGSAAPMVSGGVAPYTYAWSNGATTAELTGAEPGGYSLVVTDATGCEEMVTVEIPGTGIPMVTIDAVNSSCGVDDGSATAIVSGGEEPYSYKWSTGQDSSAIGNLGAGVYSVTVQDANSCIAVDTVVIEEEGLEVDIEVLFPSCNGGGGVLSVALNGGTGPYEFVWSTGDINPLIDELLPGTYGVTVTDSKGCEATDTETLEELDPLVIEIQQTDATCGDSNGDLEAMVSGGTAPYTYQWSTGGSTSSIGELPAGDYWVFVQDSLGCFGFELAVISESNSPDLEVIKQDVTCGGENGSATALATGTGQFFTYAWSTGDSTAVVDSLQAGIYIVTVSDESKCRQLELFTIEDNSLRVSIAKLEAATCNEANGSAAPMVSGGVAPYTYAWSNGATTAELTGAEPGGYSLVVTDATGCEEMVTVEIPGTGIPVVAIDVVHTSCGEANGSAEVEISEGLAPYDILWSTGDSTPSIDGLEPGEYSVVVRDQSGCNLESSFVIAPSSELLVELDSEITFCPDSTVVLMASATGSTGNIQFLWSTGDSTEAISVRPSMQTTYGVEVVDELGCMATGEVLLLPDPNACGGECIITAELVNQICDDNGTPDEAGDDLYTPVVRVISATGGNGWTLGNGVTGAYEEEVELGAFFIAGGTIKFRFTDVDDPDCSTELEIDPPTACSAASNPPVVSCPLSNHYCPILEEEIMLFGTTDPSGCVADLRIPLPDVTATSEECAEFVINITISDTLGNTIAVFGEDDARLIGNLGIGDYVITYAVQDICGNLVRQDCRFRVADLQEPTAVCVPALNVSIGGSGIATIPASTFDAGSIDNCGIERIEVRRQLARDPLFCSELPEPIYSPWGPEVDFTCCDVNEIIMVEILVVDLSGNENVCWLEVSVEDKTVPLCFGLEDVVVECDSLPEGFDPANIAQLQEYFGIASVFDNCNAGVTELDPVLDFSDPCNGTITRTFVGRDIFGNESEPFIQEITVQGGSFNLVGILKGALSTMNYKAIEGVEMKLSGSHYDLTSSGPTGQFRFEKLKLESDYRVTPFLDRDHRRGVSTLDLIMLNQYLLGGYEFKSPFQYIAADVNNSGVVTVLDLFELRSLVLGNIDRFHRNTSWRFVDVEHTFVEPTNPWFEEFPESSSIAFHKKPVMTSDFIGIKIGDLDGSVNASSSGAILPRSRNGVFRLMVQNQQMLAGETYVIPVSAANLEKVLGYQLSWNLDPRGLELVEIRDGVVKQENFGLGQAETGILTNSWHDIEERTFTKQGSLQGRQPMFDLVVRAKADVWLADVLSIGSRTLPAEAYHQDKGLLDVVLDYDNGPESPFTDSFTLLRNHPNPFREQTTIEFSLPKQGTVNLVISDITGRQVHQTQGEFQAGMHRVLLDARELAAGVYFCKLRWNNRQLVHKMLIQN